MRLYRQRYADTGLYENDVYDGVPQMLQRCREAAATFLATSKPKVYADRVVKHFSLDHHFTAVYGPELDGRYDDKAELVAHLLTTERVSAHAAVMIGDRATDVTAAKANRLRSVGVLWGYGSDAELRDAGADVVCAAPGELIACLSTLPSAGRR